MTVICMGIHEWRCSSTPGGWFAYFVRRDSDHIAAVQWMDQNRQRLVTTDFVFDELLTLLKMRENYCVAAAAGEVLWNETAARMEVVGPEDLARAWEVFLRYKDKEWSFTDCTSKVIMERLQIHEAFAFDHHFEQFGGILRVP